MTLEQAQTIIQKLKSGKEAHFVNTSYGRWGFEYDKEQDKFHYYSEFWGEDIENPVMEEEYLTEAELEAKLIETYYFGQLDQQLD